MSQLALKNVVLETLVFLSLNIPTLNTFYMSDVCLINTGYTRTCCWVKGKLITWPLIILHFRVTWDPLLQNVLSPQIGSGVLLREMTYQYTRDFKVKEQPRQ